MSWIGLGRIIDPITTTAAEIADEVTELLADEPARRRTGELRRSVLALPDPTEIVDHLEAALQ